MLRIITDTTQPRKMVPASDHLFATLCRRAFATVPEFWGKDSPYHGNTDFLGTPTNHRDVSRPFRADYCQYAAIDADPAPSCHRPATIFRVVPFSESPERACA